MLGGILRGLIKRIAPFRYKIVRRNLIELFPDKWKEIECRFYEELVNFIVEFAFPVEFDVEYLNSGADEIFSSEPVLVLSAHYGNWEVLSNWLGRNFSRDFIVIARTANRLNWINDFIRKKYAKVVDKLDGKGIVKGFSKGLNIGVLIDQRVKRGRVVNFAGFDVLAPDAVEKMARRYGYNVFFVVTRRKRLGKHTVLIKKISSERFLEEYFSTLWDVIKQEPAQYWWFHNRFELVNKI